MSLPAAPTPFVLDQGALSADQAEALLDVAAFARADVAVVEVTGPSAVPCIQGLLTNDVEGAGEGAFLYGAVLTAKGMIVCDMWALPHAGAVTLVAPAWGQPALEQVLRRSLPPRLARPTDRSDALEVYRVVGPRALAVAQAAALPLPEPGRTAVTRLDGAAIVVARPGAAGPFALQVQVDPARAPHLVERLEHAGAVRGDAAGLELARILAGWPRLGAEIDQKTLPQEVRFDEIEGVSYTKGCYTGQETVARLHFRGHPNRGLAGLSWLGRPDVHQPTVMQDDQDRGWVTSIAWLDPTAHYVGLAKIRREVDRARPVVAGGVEAAVVDLPFSTPT